MVTIEKITDFVDKWHEKHNNIDGIIDVLIKNINTKNTIIFKELKDCIDYIDICDSNLRKFYFVPYLDAKYYLKQIALNSDKISAIEKEDREYAFYDWLKICINPQNDPNIDFYFSENSMVKEEQIKEILFYQGKLRDIFQKDDWQIRLKKIRTWFLKRYDLWTFIRLYGTSKNKLRNWPESIDLLFPRLLCSIFIGFTISFSNSEIWDLPLNFNLLAIIIITITILALVYVYFIYECFHAVGGEKDTISIAKRVFPIFFIYGIGYSFLFSYLFYGIHSCDFLNSGWFNCNKDLVSSIKIISFFAVIALSIGILIQTIWEEKTVTEPL